MLIPINRPSGAADVDDDTPQEWSLLELNGELVPPTALPKAGSSSNGGARNGDASGIELGAVRFSSDGTPVMTLGSHELKGKIEKLKQPFVVMRKRKRAHGLTGGVDEKLDLESMDTYAATVEDHGSTDGSVSYEVAGIITQKMLFDKYPKSIMR